MGTGHWRWSFCILCCVSERPKVARLDFFVLSSLICRPKASSCSPFWRKMKRARKMARHSSLTTTHNELVQIGNVRLVCTYGKGEETSSNSRETTRLLLLSLMKTYNTHLVSFPLLCAQGLSGEWRKPSQKLARSIFGSLAKSTTLGEKRRQNFFICPAYSNTLSLAKGMLLEAMWPNTGVTFD